MEGGGSPGNLMEGGGSPLGIFILLMGINKFIMNTLIL